MYFQKNQLIYEKLVCKRHPGSKIDQYQCLMKYIDRNHMKIDTWANATSPVTSVNLHLTLFYKYNVYHQVGGNVNLNICDVMNKKLKLGPTLDWAFYVLSKYSNIDRGCPYDGFVYYKTDNVSINEFALPLYMMPAGRYRIDSMVFEDNGRILFNMSSYFSISDHRVDVSYSKL